MRSRPLAGPLLVLGAALALLASSLQSWYRLDLSRLAGGSELAARYAHASGLATGADAWAPWSAGSALVLGAAIAGGAALALAGIGSDGRRAGAAAGAIVLGALASVVTLSHALHAPRPAALVQVTAWPWAGFGCTLALLAGAILWWDHATHPG